MCWIGIGCGTFSSQPCDSESGRSFEDSALCQKQRQDIVSGWLLRTLFPSFGSDGGIN